VALRACETMVGRHEKGKTYEETFGRKQNWCLMPSEVSLDVYVIWTFVISGANDAELRWFQVLTWPSIFARFSRQEGLCSRWAESLIFVFAKIPVGDRGQKIGGHLLCWWAVKIRYSVGRWWSKAQMVHHARHLSRGELKVHMGQVLIAKQNAIVLSSPVAKSSYR